MSDTRNRRTVTMLAVIVVAMTGLAFASAPLYRMFCEATGFAGTPGRAREAATRLVARNIEIRFNGNVAPDLAWSFRTPERTRIQLGESALVAFHADNREDRSVTGTATFNVTPEKAGRYFVKTQCFCFEEQTLAAHAGADLPVYFFVDPALADDPDMADVRTITLSYSFFKARPRAADAVSASTTR